MFVYYFFFYFFFFFFSSRRRHTRSLCDWSSDVCSSDLSDHRPVAPSRRDRLEYVVLQRHLAAGTLHVDHWGLAGHRSEERRVGKECRYRWWTDHLNTNKNRSTLEGD